ncbi:hypothetical protein A6R68_11016 [Neotoma lepida]|uniref:AF4/FMR2 C-terminal homology domain-containing protein n=1 Tax=Neotoma lepida TaxID=56216 RepID=A0A1A6FV69_NEOLE|nr:hypothetical protein A6R68_11016 [Neotoma lepida]
MTDDNSSVKMKSTKTAHKRSKPDADTCSQDPPKSASSTKSNSKDSSVPKHRKVQARGSEYKVDKAGKAFKYLEAVLSYIECGMAMESESSAKSAYAVYSETVDLVKFTMSLKSFTDTTAPAQEKIFAILCLRCQSLLNMAMFRCKKDIVMNSVGSQSSAGSMGSSGVTATISTPVTIQNMTSSYVTITSHVLKAFDLWEQAEALTKKNKEFFAQLSTKVRVLALNSSLVDLVHYTRQGLQRLKQAPKAP